MALFQVKLLSHVVDQTHFRYIFLEIQHVVNICKKIHRRFYNIGQVVDEDYEKNRTEDTSLRNTTQNCQRIIYTAVNSHQLWTICQKVVNPFANLTVDTIAVEFFSLAFEMVQCRMLLRSRSRSYQLFPYRPSTKLRSWDVVDLPLMNPNCLLEIKFSLADNNSFCDKWIHEIANNSLQQHFCHLFLKMGVHNIVYFKNWYQMYWNILYPSKVIL